MIFSVWREPRLPLDFTEDATSEPVDDYIHSDNAKEDIIAARKKTHEEVLLNIKKAQARQKKNHDKLFKQQVRCQCKYNRVQ